MANKQTDLMVLIQGAEEQTTIQWENSLWLRKGDDRIMREGDEGSSDDHVRQERICNDYVERRHGWSLTTRYGE
jgi:hypothetical protein